MFLQHPDDLADEMGDGFGSNERARAHENMTMIARAEGLIGGKAEAIKRAKFFVKNGIQAVLFGAPRYSELDAVMGYKWSLVFVGNAGAVQKFLDKALGDTGEGDDLQVEIVK
jgi:2-methylisocitrate lyase-like PEP mutase family enzyme